jgi:hypothetical protein
MKEEGKEMMTMWDEVADIVDRRGPLQLQPGMVLNDTGEDFVFATCPKCNNGPGDVVYNDIFNTNIVECLHCGYKTTDDDPALFPGIG